jgi:hypothetical protein
MRHAFALTIDPYPASLHRRWLGSWLYDEARYPLARQRPYPSACLCCKRRYERSASGFELDSDRAPEMHMSGSGYTHGWPRVGRRFPSLELDATHVLPEFDGVAICLTSDVVHDLVKNVNVASRRIKRTQLFTVNPR